jgi:RNA polymerase primary sigma factor
MQRVHSGELPFDRTIKVSLTENLEKDKILQRMPHNLKTLEHLLEQNRDDFMRSLDEALSDEDKKKFRRSLRAPVMAGGVFLSVTMNHLSFRNSLQVH